MALEHEVDERLDGAGGDATLRSRDGLAQRGALIGRQRACGDGLRDAPVLALQPEGLQLCAVRPFILRDARAIHGRDRLQVLIPIAIADADDHHGNDGHGEGDESEGHPSLEPLLGIEGSPMRGRAATSLLVGRHALLRRV